jgi:hypothetical protein
LGPHYHFPFSGKWKILSINQLRNWLRCFRIRDGRALDSHALDGWPGSKWWRRKRGYRESAPFFGDELEAHARLPRLEAAHAAVSGCR